MYNTEATLTLKSNEEGARATMPINIIVKERGDVRELCYTWFTWKALLLMLIGILQTLVSARNFGVALTDPESPNKGVLLILLAFILLIVGIAMVYIGLAGLLNQSFIQVAGDRLKVRHAPLPWPGSRELMMGDIAYFFVNKQIISTRNGDIQSYEVCATLHNKESYQLLGWVEKHEQARFIRQTLEKWLKA